MVYCAQSDLLLIISEDELIQLTDDNAGEIDDEKVSAAIAYADGIIDSYCGLRYTVPFVTVPDVIKNYSVDIAIYRLYMLRKGAPDDRVKAYDDAIAFLKLVSKGGVSLGASDPDPTPAERNNPVINSNTRVFTRNNMDGF